MKQRFVKALMAGGLLATMIVTGVAATPATANDRSTTGSGSGPTCVVSQAPLNVSGGKQAEFGTVNDAGERNATGRSQGGRLR